MNFAYEIILSLSEYIIFTRREFSRNSDININSAGNVFINRSSNIEKIDTKERQVQEEKQAQKILEVIKRYFNVSIGCSKLISKKYESVFVVSFYFKEKESSLKNEIEAIIGKNYSEKVYDSTLVSGQRIKVSLYSPDFIFSGPVVKNLDLSINSINFLGKPQETCEPGEHKIILSVVDNKTNLEFFSTSFSVKVVDYIFDHVSRPLISKVSTVILGAGSFVMFILTLLEQIDKTVGLTSGTAAGILAVFIYGNFYNLYKRTKLISN
jgi:hypothetical protein